MTRNRHIGFFVIAVGLALTPFFLTYTQLQIDTKQDFATVMATFGKLFVVAVLMERAVEVILSTLRSGGADQYDNEIRGVEKDISKAEEDIKSGAAGAAPVTAAQTRLDQLKPRLVQLLSERSDYRATSRSYALWIGLIIGLLVAAVGIRFLGTIVKVDPTKLAENHWQYELFVTVDIVLTGTLLAGGSDAFNKVTKAYSAFMDKVKEANKT